MPHRKQIHAGNWRYTAVSSEMPDFVNLGLELFLKLLTDVKSGLKSVDVRQSLTIYFIRIFNEALSDISQEA